MVCNSGQLFDLNLFLLHSLSHAPAPIAVLRRPRAPFIKAASLGIA